MLFRKLRNIGVGQNFDQSNFERRKRQGAIQTIAMLLPLAGDARVSVKKSGDQIGFVAVDIARLATADEISQQGFSHFGIRIGGERLP